MADILPFRGVHYDTAVVGALERVIGPPYDVISPAEQDALYAADEHNYVRVMLNRSEPSDTADNDVYTRAAGFLRSWLAEGVLVQDAEPSLYVYEQEFASPADGQRLVRRALVCALKLEPYSAGVVLPHEETKPKAKEDRLRLMRATRTNPEAILLNYEDPAGEVVRTLSGGLGTAPLLDAAVDGDAHRVWRTADPTIVRHVQGLLQDRRLWIADGHHRYETALSYRDEVLGGPDAGARGDGGGAGYMLVALTAFEDPGLVVLPTHRLVRGIPVGRLEQLNLQLDRYFLVEPVRLEDLPVRMAAAPGTGVHRFGRVSQAGAAVLTLRDESLVDAAEAEHSPVWRRLDVSILQTLVLDRSLGMPAATIATTPDIAYTRDSSDAVARVHNGEFQMAFLLNRPAPDEVRQVAAAGDKMPAKSTFFYPKLWSGLLLRRLDE